VRRVRDLVCPILAVYAHCICAVQRHPVSLLRVNRAPIPAAAQTVATTRNRSISSLQMHVWAVPFVAQFQSCAPNSTLNCRPRVLPSLPKTSPAAAAAVSFPGAVAVLAIHRPVAARLKGDCCLLAASGTGDRCALRFTPVSSASASGLLVLFRLAARLAAFRSRIAPFLEERLILACKRKILSAVAAGHLLISHKTLSFVRSQLADICRGHRLANWSCRWRL
jgi:hypothetical protein